MSATPEQSDASSRESSSAKTPEVYKMSKKQRMEKWKRVGEFGGVGILEKALNFYGIKPIDKKRPSNPPEPQPAAEPVPEVPKQPTARRAPPSKIVKPAPRPSARPATRPAVNLPSSIDSGDAAQALAARRPEQRRKMPPKGIFTAPRPGLTRVMPIPIEAPPPSLQPPPRQYHNPLWHAHWPLAPAMNSTASGSAPPPNPLRLPPWKRGAQDQFRR